MTLTTTATTITSDQTTHTARLAHGSQHLWEVSWLSGHPLDRTSATNAIIVADLAGDADLNEQHHLWPFIQAWAAELGLTGSDAISRASQPGSGLHQQRERERERPDPEAGQ